MTALAGTPPALFTSLGDDIVMATDLARGPWGPSSLHGGPVAALIARAVEHVRARDASDDVDWFVSRLTVELERPVPLEPLRVDAAVTRPGRKVSIVEVAVALADGARVLARARALRIRRAGVPLPDDPELAAMLGIDPPPPGPAMGRVGDIVATDYVAFHHSSVEHRFVREASTTVGPLVDWIRMTVPLIEGEELSPLQRVAGAADFANGISHVLPFETHLFVNPDLTVHLFREPRGEWIGMDSATHHSPHGIGMTDTALFDVDGRIGHSNQSLLLDTR